MWAEGDSQVPRPQTGCSSSSSLWVDVGCVVVRVLRQTSPRTGRVIDGRVDDTGYWRLETEESRLETGASSSAGGAPRPTPSRTKHVGSRAVVVDVAVVVAVTGTLA
ncbi:hypothetical protein CPLU01_04333 [Colletotrichum plurivorum]|uniref:Uncharacterized protein n=1 Tax=Colletotrichum plurivorum TaxID=2175906 RepID=A0A8H6KPU4_9PEZI|nr:hypothetical protein CPLU01_04333 [Colletotrichum plurivorum]